MAQFETLEKKKFFFIALLLYDFKVISSSEYKAFPFAFLIKKLEVFFFDFIFKQFEIYSFGSQ